jgi:hypothetical protein
MGFRNYDPGLNQFTSRDMYDGATQNMGLTTDPFTGGAYAFGNGNPVSNIEQDGHAACTGLQALINVINSCGAGPGAASSPAASSGGGSSSGGISPSNPSYINGPPDCHSGEPGCATTYYGGNNVINAPSRNQLSRAISAAQDNMSTMISPIGGYANPQEGIAYWICKSHPSWCAQMTSAPNPESPTTVLNMMLGMVTLGGMGESGGENPLGAKPVDDPAFSSGLAGAADGLPAYDGKTAGVGEVNGTIYNVISGNKKADAQLISTVNSRLRAAGLLKGTSNSQRASDVEQKFAAMMSQGGGEGTLVINNLEGPCPQPLGCNHTLPAILGNSKLTVYWPRSDGGWWMKEYGG